MSTNILDGFDSRRRRASRDDDNDRTIYADELLQSLNSTTTVADLILNDTDRNKLVSLGVISRHSAIAKTIIDAIDDNESLRLGTVNAINVLKLMSDIFDNKLAVVNQ